MVIKKIYKVIIIKVLADLKKILIQETYVSITMEIINTKRNGKKLCLDGYMYTCKHVAKEKDQITWRCVKRTTAGCKAILQTTKDYEGASLNTNHNHITDNIAAEIEKTRQEMKSTAKSSNDKPNQIVTFTTSTASDEVKARLPEVDTLKRVLRRTRATHRPPQPQTLRELTIQHPYTQSVGEDPTNFLLYDNGPEADERVMVFATENHVQQLASCDKWCMDGTFAVAPLLFTQLYVIQGLVNGVFLPLVYALLQRKTQSTYEILFSVLEELGCDPSTVILDFERSVEMAVSSVFGDHVNIQFCFYHLTQSIWRKIQSLGLTNRYENDNGFRLFCGQIDALAFLPLEEVSEGMDLLKETAPEEAESLVHYFDSTYVSGQLRPRRNNNGLVVNFRRIPPLYPPHRWNCHQVTMMNQPRTNNASEGWNNKFHSLVGQDHPCVWKLIENLQRECARVSSILLQDERGVRPKKRVKKVYVELQVRLRNLCEDRISERRTLPEFLRGVSSNLRAGQPNI